VVREFLLVNSKESFFFFLIGFARRSPGIFVGKEIEMKNARVIYFQGQLPHTSDLFFLDSALACDRNT